MGVAAAALPDQATDLRTWKASLFEDEPYCDNFRAFVKLRGAPVTPTEAPARLPGLPSGVEPGQLLSAAELQQRLAEADAAALHPEVGASVSVKYNLDDSAVQRVPLVPALDRMPTGMHDAVSSHLVGD